MTFLTIISEFGVKKIRKVIIITKDCRSQNNLMYSLTFFLKIDKVKFKKQVVPGDTLIFKLELLEPIRRGIVTMWGQAFVGETLAAEAELCAQFAKAK